MGARREEDFSNSDTHHSLLVSYARTGALSVGMGVIIRTFLGRGGSRLRLWNKEKEKQSRVILVSGWDT